MLQGVHLIFGCTRFPLSLENHQARKRLDLGIYSDWCISSMDDARMLCAHARSVRTPNRSAWAHYCPGHVVHARTQQHMRQAALRVPCATAELRRREQGCI